MAGPVRDRPRHAPPCRHHLHARSARHRHCRTRCAVPADQSKQHVGFLNANYAQFPAHRPTPRPRLEVHPIDAAALGVTDGMSVHNSGSPPLKPPSAPGQPGLSQCSFGWGHSSTPEGRAVNALTNPAVPGTTPDRGIPRHVGAHRGCLTLDDPVDHEETVTLVHAAATWFLVGLIWIIQVVHYPLFAWSARTASLRTRRPTAYFPRRRSGDAVEGVATPWFFPARRADPNPAPIAGLVLRRPPIDHHLRYSPTGGSSTDGIPSSPTARAHELDPHDRLTIRGARPVHDRGRRGTDTRPTIFPGDQLRRTAGVSPSTPTPVSPAGRERLDSRPPPVASSAGPHGDLRERGTSPPTRSGGVRCRPPGFPTLAAGCEPTATSSGLSGSATSPSSHDAVTRLEALGVELSTNTFFITDYREFGEWAEGRKRIRMEDFYRRQRIDLDVLTTATNPPAGRTSTTRIVNRQDGGRGQADLFPLDAIDRDVMTELEASDDVALWGAALDGRWPVTRAQALERLQPSSTRDCRASAPTRTPCLRPNGSSPTVCSAAR